MLLCTLESNVSSVITFALPEGFYKTKKLGDNYPDTGGGYSVAEAAESLGVRTNLIYKWKEKFEAQANGSALSQDERAELKQLRAENKRLKLEKEILKKASALLAQDIL